MRQFLLAAASCAALLACSHSEGTTTTATPVADIDSVDAAAETIRFTAWLDEEYKELLDFSPVMKAFLGIKDEDYSKVDDMSLEAVEKQLNWRRDSVARMKMDFERDLLSDDAKISYDMWVYELHLAEEAAKFPFHPYALEQMNGAQGFYPQFLMQFHSVETEADMLAYIARIKGFARAFNQTMDRVEAADAKGMTAPYFAIEGVLDQSRNIATGAPFDDSAEPSMLLADAQSKVDTLIKDGEMSSQRGAELLEQAKAAYAGDFAAAYNRVIDWHAAKLPNMGDAKGAWSLPDGEAYYKQRLLHSTTTDYSAEKIHNIGLSEVARLRGEMEAVKELAGFDGTLDDFFEFVRTDPSNFFADTDAGREAYLDSARDFIGEIEAKLPNYFGILPKADLEVKRVESFREQDGAAQHYFPGTPDGSRPGVYYVHLSDMTAMPMNQIEVIAYHEALPGHHMQLSIAQELENVPQFRTQAYYNSFGEGWALYSEQLAKEMGGYEDPISEFGRLSSEMFRAIRLVVDTGLHAKGWSEQQAIDYFLANSPEPEESIKSEVRRYLVWPGQATGYKIGMIKILELRRNAMDELGEEFDIRGFHDVVLGGGAVPLDILEKRVEAWVAEVKAG